MLYHIILSPYNIGRPAEYVQKKRKLFVEWGRAFLETKHPSCPCQLAGWPGELQKGPCYCEWRLATTWTITIKDIRTQVKVKAQPPFIDKRRSGLMERDETKSHKLLI